MASSLSKAVSFRNALQQALPKSLSPNSSYSSHRSDSGRYVPLSHRDHDPDLDPDLADQDDEHEGHRIQMSADMSVDMSVDLDYTVHIPPTPDNQPMSAAAAVAAAGTAKKEVTGTLFSRGPDKMLRTRTLKQRTGSHNPALAVGTERQITRTGVFCSTDGCGGDPLRDELGQILFPCECRYLICRDCYWEALQNGETGICPGCKEAYWIADNDNPDESSARGPPLPLPAPNNSNAQLDRRISLLKPVKSLVRSHTSDFDQSSWLYSSKGTYGYGNAVWPEASSGFVNGGGVGVGGRGADLGPRPDFKELARRPLTRKIRIPAGILSPYRLLVLIRLVALSLFLMWRVKNINHDAIWLWGMSVVCEIWFAFSWLLDQLPKLNPVNRAVDLACLRDKFESPSPNNPEGVSDLPGIDVFVSTADAEKEPPLVTANTILSILAIEYPVDKLACYLSDDGGALITFEAQAEAASFAKHWVPFCRKHNIEPRNPESYFATKGDPTKNKVRPDFVKDRRRIKREYDEFKVRINGLPDAIRRRSDAFNAHQEARARRAQMESGTDLGEASQDVLVATWMADGTHWPGTWTKSSKEHSKGDHAGIIQVMLEPPSSEPVFGNDDEDNLIDTTDVDIRLPTLAYVSREKHSGYDHNKKAGAMNALVRASAVMTNGAFILNLDCDHYVYNSMAVREGMCFMMDRGGENICFVQFPQRFEGIDPSDRYANHNTVFFDGNMRALDGLQGPMYVGTGCLFRRVALYGFDPPRIKDRGGICPCCGPRAKHHHSKSKVTQMGAPTTMNGGFSDDDDDDNMGSQLLPKKFGNSNLFLDSIGVAEKQGRPLQDHPCVKYGRKPGSLIGSREALDAPRVAEALSVVSCWYEDKTEWGRRVGWIYGSVTEDVVTGYCMHKKGWRSVYCVTKRDAFRGTAPINLTDRLHQVLRWATGSVEIFFSRNNGLLAGPRMKILQRIAYLNVGIYPFTSIFLLVYCFLPALSLFTNQFIVQTLSVTFLVYLLSITITLCLLAILEIKWAGITLEDWWRNEQFWLIGGTSAHLAAVLQGLLKVIAGIQISFTLTSKSANDEENDSFADLYIVKWSSLMIPPLTIMMVNMIAIAVGVARTIYSSNPEWSKLLGGGFFSLWVLMHLYPFAKGLMGRRGRTPTIIWVWSGLISITISLLWVAITNPSSSSNSNNGTGFQFP